MLEFEESLQTRKDRSTNNQKTKKKILTILKLTRAFKKSYPILKMMSQMRKVTIENKVRKESLESQVKH